MLLNRNARRVTDRVMRKIEQIAGSENVYYSRNLDEAEAFCREIVKRVMEPWPAAVVMEH